jgi:hypothetical protein
VTGTRTFTGTATLDGQALDTKFLGAVVRRDGLVTPCQAELPAVAGGRYEIDVLAEPDGTGCGRPGAEVLLWIYVGETKVFSTEPIPWPDGAEATAGVDFMSATPLGGVGSPILELNGIVVKEGIRMPAGTEVEALVDDTVCGVASVREAESFTGYILNVVGPDAVPGCTAGEPITFRVGGEPTVETSVNSPDHSGTLDLTVAP